MTYKFFLLTIVSVFVYATLSAQCIGEQGTVKWYYWENVDGYDLEDLYPHHSFPQSPDGYEEITSLEMPYNYGEGLGAIVKGYIKPTTTNTYTFNVTGTDHVIFFLSTTQSPSDTVLMSEVDGWTQRDEHDKYPEQTSAPVTLTAGQYYYFEFHQKDDNGWDHAEVFWKTSPSDPSWATVPNTNLYNYDCYTTCPIAGTPCDDGDANTSNDIADGACNCLGTPNDVDACAGERGSIRAFYWDNIPGGDVYDLQSSSNYPMSPDRTELLTAFKGPSDDHDDSEDSGARVQALLIAPETGDYQFNVTGDDETWLYFSSTPDFNLATVIAEVPGWTHNSEFDKYISQTSTTISLTKGQIYYIEINNKQGVGGHHFGVAWKTPSNTDNWKYIDGIYLYYYDCEEACTPEGTVCDDNDPTTHSDVYDANCNCVGTPCPNGDCTGLGYEPSFPNYDKCGPTDKHNDQEQDAWLSCMPKPSPNPARGVGHWIQYNFKQALPLGGMKIWNYNVPGETGRGFELVAIDYSVDGSTWLELGQFNWQQAPGTTDYQGFTGPDFGGIQAQYVLITALNNFDNGSCMGFSQVEFQTTACTQAGAICDTGNGEAAVYDIHCDCQSLSEPFNDCAEEYLVINTTPINTNNYSVRRTIESAGIVNSGSIVNMVAGESITLLPGFRAKNGADFWAVIEACSNGQEEYEEPEERALAQAETPDHLFEESEGTDLIIYPTPTNSWTTINFQLEQAAQVDLSIVSSTGQRLFTLAKSQAFAAGSHQKTFPAQRLAGGVYYVRLQTEDAIQTKSMVVVDAMP